MQKKFTGEDPFTKYRHEVLDALRRFLRGKGRVTVAVDEGSLWQSRSALARSVLDGHVICGKSGEFLICCTHWNVPVKVLAKQRNDGAGNRILHVTFCQPNRSAVTAPD